MLSGTQDAGSNQVQGRTRILPASEVLLSLAGSGSGSGSGSPSRMNMGMLRGIVMVLGLFVMDRTG